MNTKKYYLDGFRKLKETLARLLKPKQKQVVPQVVPLPRRRVNGKF
jgi:hypothetical protein